jgi:hypothetical protein
VHIYIDRIKPPGNDELWYDQVMRPVSLVKLRADCRIFFPSVLYFIFTAAHR